MHLGLCDVVSPVVVVVDRVDGLAILDVLRSRHRPPGPPLVSRLRMVVVMEAMMVMQNKAK